MRSHTVCFIALACCAAQGAHALEVAPGDYEAYPPNANIALLYYQHAETSRYYQDGRRTSNDFGTTSDIGLFRYIHPLALAPHIVLDPQFILPFGHLSTSGDASALGDRTGVGDLIVGAPVKFVLDERARNTASIGPFLYVPTGSYDASRALNIGEHRWKFLLQFAYIHHFNDTWAVDTVADVQFAGHNRDATVTGGTLAEKPRYEAQAYVRYTLSGTTTLWGGGGYVAGARQTLDGVDENNRLSTSYGRLGVTQFMTPTTQVQAIVGSDLSVHQGSRERLRIDLRLAKVF
ncbi:transporter [Robbsia sp. Bb-Pol-6]|uniref:Transporter n=1 Tax=Robbsia betulipollinis TaxID=2981849 RepID=A0ABT3ZKD5_9BURK|nr:transporter [Robbsia betulipollinis]MCY0386989.1 transporter [Robbsia betulipollinis]